MVLAAGLACAGVLPAVVRADAAPGSAAEPAAGTPSPASAGPIAGNATPELKSAIAAGNRRYLDGLVRGDAATYASAFAPDAVLLPAGGPAIHGRAAIEANQRDTFKTIKFSGGDVVTTEIHQSGDIAYEIGVYNFRLVPVSAPDAGRSVRGRYLTLWHRGGGGEWQIVVDSGQPNAPA
jgi:uncharacterized protein (TIGR02246 family)